MNLKEELQGKGANLFSQQEGYLFVEETPTFFFSLQTYSHCTLAFKKIHKNQAARVV